jgi:hypothetical protein
MGVTLAACKDSGAGSDPVSEPGPALFTKASECYGLTNLSNSPALSVRLRLFPSSL